MKKLILLSLALFGLVLMQETKAQTVTTLHVGNNTPYPFFQVMVSTGGCVSPWGPPISSTYPIPPNVGSIFNVASTQDHFNGIRVINTENGSFENFNFCPPASNGTSILGVLSSPSAPAGVNLAVGRDPVMPWIASVRIW